MGRKDEKNKERDNTNTGLFPCSTKWEVADQSEPLFSVYSWTNRSSACQTFYLKCIQLPFRALIKAGVSGEVFTLHKLDVPPMHSQDLPFLTILVGSIRYDHLYHSEA